MILTHLQFLPKLTKQHMNTSSGSSLFPALPTSDACDENVMNTLITSARLGHENFT